MYWDAQNGVAQVVLIKAIEMFEQTFKNIDDILHKDAGCGSELDYVEQTNWILFLKYLDDLEKDRATAAELTGKTYTPIIDKDYQWSIWATPKGKDGKLDHHIALSGDDLADIQEKDHYDVVLANPPFGGKERAEVQQNFPIKTGETASLFLQHFIKILKAGGKAGVVIKNTFLSHTDNATVAIRKTLPSTCNLHTVLDLPGGAFAGAGVKTVVLFFKKGKPTQKVWFYQLNLNRNLGKTNPLNENDLAEFIELQKTFADSENSWTVNVKDIDQSTFDLSVKNPNKKEVIRLRSPNEILDEMRELDREADEVLESIAKLIV